MRGSAIIAAYSSYYYLKLVMFISLVDAHMANITLRCMGE